MLKKRSEERRRTTFSEIGHDSESQAPLSKFRREASSRARSRFGVLQSNITITTESGGPRMSPRDHFSSFRCLAWFRKRPLVRNRFRPIGQHFRNISVEKKRGQLRRRNGHRAARAGGGAVLKLNLTGLKRWKTTPTWWLPSTLEHSWNTFSSPLSSSSLDSGTQTKAKERRRI